MHGTRTLWVCCAPHGTLRAQFPLHGDPPGLLYAAWQASGPDLHCTGTPRPTLHGAGQEGGLQAAPQGGAELQGGAGQGRRQQQQGGQAGCWDSAVRPGEGRGREGAEERRGGERACAERAAGPDVARSARRRRGDSPRRRGWRWRWG